MRRAPELSACRSPERKTASMSATDRWAGKNSSESAMSSSGNERRIRADHRGDFVRLVRHGVRLPIPWAARGGANESCAEAGRSARSALEASRVRLPGVGPCDRRVQTIGGLPQAGPAGLERPRCIGRCPAARLEGDARLRWGVRGAATRPAGATGRPQSGGGCERLARMSRPAALTLNSGQVRVSRNGRSRPFACLQESNPLRHRLRSPPYRQCRLRCPRTCTEPQ